ncbi:MAG TPA: YciI family protein [Streptosporangiaceae bacterium]|nr:YciI family protein [Streptosporangiaceae bacterium]
MMSAAIGAARRETIMRYLCLLTGDPDSPGPEPGSAEFQQMMDDYQTATAAMAGSGVLVDSGPLEMPSTARSLRMRNGEPLVTDGPFIEVKEVIGGYYVLECSDMDEALRWASTIPAARYGVIEVRPVMTMGGPG